MGDPVFKALFMEEQEKLKEKLALLKKEYNRTLSRLQRSQRAERVTARSKKTTAEQNHSFSRESMGSPVAGPSCSAPDAPGQSSDSERTRQTSVARKDGEMSAIFNLDPEVLRAQSGGTPQGSRGSLYLDCTPVTHTTMENRDQTPRSRLKLNRSRKSESSAGSPHASSHLPNNALRALGSPSVCEASSPVYGKVATSHNSPLLVERPGVTAGLLVPVAETKKHAGASNGDHTELELPASLTRDHFTRHNNQPWQLVSLNGVEGTSAAKSVEEPRGGKFDIRREEKGLTASAATSSKVAAAGRTCNEGSETLKTPQARKRNTKCGARESAEPKPEQRHNPGQRESCLSGENSPLSSCTLVEGLLFPVEYYVRTTRRMSSCQRKVDLDAVLHTQLGTSRRISRGRSKQGKASHAQDASVQSQSAGGFAESGSAVVGTPMGTLSRQPTGKSRGKRRKGKGGNLRGNVPAATDSPDLKDIAVQVAFAGVASGSQSEKENYQEQTGLDPQTGSDLQRTNGETEKPKNKDLNADKIPTPLQVGQNALRMQNPAGFSCDALQEDTGSFENAALDLRFSKPDPKCAGPLFPFSRTGLKRLPSPLHVLDFHLPDDEFADLKLKKLKEAAAALCQSEPLVSNRHTERKSHGKEGVTAPPTGHSPNLQGATSLCFGDLESKFKPHNPGGDHLSNAGAPLTNPPVSSASPGCDLTSTQLGLTPDLPNILNLTATCPDQSQETQESQGLDLRHDYLSPNYLDGAGQGDSCEEQDVSLLQPSVAGQVSGGLFVADTQGTSTFLSEGPETHEETRTAGDVPLKRPPLAPSFEPRLNTNVRTPRAKDDACGVLLSTSLCSVPLLTFEVASSGQGLPLLGSTPALPPSLPGRDSPLTSCRAKPRTQDFGGPEASAARVNSSESMTVGSDRRLFPESNVNLTASPSGSGRKRCVDEELQQQWRGRCVNRRLGYPVDGIFSQDSCRGAHAVDLASSRWDFPDRTDWCVQAASESSVTLWRPRGDDSWEAAHTWSFTEMPVIQILPLPGETNAFCVALGNLEIREIWLLFSYPGSLNYQQRAVRRGHAKTAQGLSRCQVAICSGQGSGQVVEVMQLSTKGGTAGSHTLMPPEDSVLTFCEVDGQPDALLGSTVNSNVVIWNRVTGQLLSTVCVGDLCRDFTCLSASCESGLVFMVLAGPYSSECVFTLIAANPRGAQCVPVMRYMLPGHLQGRYLEGDVKNQSAVAVLTCGNIALWELPSSKCSALLHPTSDSPWCLVRWAHTASSSVLAGQKDGTIHVYSYTGENPAERSEETEMWESLSTSGVTSC
uniref:Partner and localiser of BRCA2 WD40 domain-containing protein n=1 Tax=Leptobrachium leishanense TaxID=445787 RepID=A0A8C5WDP8_9ANUR